MSLSQALNQFAQNLGRYLPLPAAPFTTRPSHGERSLTSHVLKAQ